MKKINISSTIYIYIYIYIYIVELYHLYSRIFRLEFMKYNSNYTRAHKPGGIIGVI